MPGFRVGTATFFLALLFGCSDADPQVGTLVALGPSGPARSFGPGAFQSDGGAGGVSSVSEPLCGNGRRELDEECDPGDAQLAMCSEFGLDSGTVGCSESCEWDLSLCVGAEDCSDGLDNDGDGEVDCLDTDCAQSCAQSCDSSSVMEIQGGETHIWGSTVGRTSELNSACTFPHVVAPERVFAVRAAEAGVLSASLWTVEALGASFRSSCGDQALVSSCTGDQVETFVEAGEVSYLVIDGLVSGAEGEFDLTLSLRGSSSCGDGMRGGSEECDDGNHTDSDGCSQSCTREPTESEPNDSLALAQGWSGEAPYYGEFSSSNDEDFLRLDLESSVSSLRLSVDDDGGQGCSQEEPGMNPAIELLSSSGDPLAWDDDSGMGDCASLFLSELEAGTYYLRLLPQMSGSFPYRLTMQTE